MAVIDASVLVAYLAGGDRAVAARDVVFANAGSLWAPHLVDAEVGHALRRVVSAGQLSALKGRSALQDLADLPIERVPHRALLDRAWQLRPNVSFYVGLYIALAETLQTPLVTLDERLAAAPGSRAKVRLLA